MPKKRIAFLVSHGTDTMAWGLSYLTYALKNCPSPVALVGSQLPMTERFSSSDAYPNIELAMDTLVEICEPTVFLAFDSGKKLFTETTWKHDKWDPNAFVGNIIGQRDSNRFIHVQKLKRQQQGLDRLYIIRTGGTIEAGLEEGADGSETLSNRGPKPDLVHTYIHKEYHQKKGVLGDVEDVPFPHQDSSDLTLEDWRKIAQLITECSAKEGYKTEADDRFEPDVRLVMCSPFLRTEDYARLMEGAAGVVLLGYGAGNINIRKDAPFSPLPALEAFVTNGGHAVLCSHVDCGVIDSLYENGAEVFRAGLAAPGAHYSPAAAQMKLSFILGHLPEIVARAELLAADRGGQVVEWERRIIRALFLAGARFASDESRLWFETTLEVRSAKTDFLVNRTFKDSLERVTAQLEEHPRPSTTILTGDKDEELHVIHDAVVVKPDANVGENRRGEPVDAARSVAAILEQGFEWHVAIAEPSYLQRMKSSEIADALATARVLYWEGGNPSVHLETSFNALGRSFLLGLVREVFRRRSSVQGFPPSIMICLSHQLAAQAIFDIVRCLGPLPAGNGISEDVVSDWNRFLERHRSMMQRMDLSEHAVGHGREKETGIVRLVPFSSLDGIPAEVKEAHQKVAASYSGLVEDIMPSEPLDLAMLHGDVVLPLPLLFSNWALQEVNQLKCLHPGLNAVPELADLPIGVEITSSTIKDGEVLTAVASMAIYYLTKEGYLCRDLTFQFHPELIDEGALMPLISGQEVALSFKNDGVKLLVGATMAVQERNRVNGA